MLSSLMSWFEKINRRTNRQISPFLNVGFHGDKYLLELVASLAKQTEIFVETGTNVGSTLAYFGRTFPSVQCYSCEPDKAAYREVLQNIHGLNNVGVFNLTSQEFLTVLEREHPDIFLKKTLFWLDAHGYGFEWPLRDEIAFVTSKFENAYILIDDFKVPMLDIFGYDQYNGQVCSLEYIQSALAHEREYRLYYPSYSEKTSGFHPLRGWGLIHWPSASFEIPTELKDKIRAGNIMLNFKASA